MLKTRYLELDIAQDLKEKMVFVGGPRQVGKTTLAQSIGRSGHKKFAYFNWDNRADKRAILRGEFNPEAALLIFDELHKYRPWKRYIKGMYDTRRDRVQILVTGSARLDLYRKGGDSLMGRYHYFRLHPFSLREALGSRPHLAPGEALEFAPSSPETRTAFEALSAFGGFPEPFLKQDMRMLRRWRDERIDRVVVEDIREIELIRDLSALHVLTELMPEKVGSLFSLNALREDLEVAHHTVALWVDILENFYYLYRIYPHASTAVKSLRKQPKAYLWDWSAIDNEAVKLENLIASHLLKFTHFLRDREGYRTELKYLRDAAGHEVDFLVTIDRKPWFAVEVKSARGAPLKNLRYFDERLRIPFLYQVVGEHGVDYLQDKIRVMSVDKFLTGLV